MGYPFRHFPAPRGLVMKTEERPAPKPAPHVLEVMAIRFYMHADRAWRDSQTPCKVTRRLKLGEAMAWVEAAEECRASLAELQKG